jgi:hypothetical protein
MKSTGLLTLDMTLKRAMGGRLDLMGPAMAVQKELMSIPDFGAEDETAFCQRKKISCQPEEGHPDGIRRGRAKINDEN